MIKGQARLAVRGCEGWWGGGAAASALGHEVAHAGRQAQAEGAEVELGPAAVQRALAQAARVRLRLPVQQRHVPAGKAGRRENRLRPGPA